MICTSSISCPLAYGFDNPYLIQQSLEALMGPAGVLAGVVGVVLLLGVISSRRVYWGVVALLLFASTVTSHLTQTFNHPYTGVLQGIAEQGRNIVLGLLLILLLPALMDSKGNRKRLIHGGMIAYLAFQLLYTFEIAAARSDGSLVRFVIGIMLFVLTFAVLAFGLSKTIQSFDDAVTAVRAVAWCGVIFVTVTSFELLNNPKAVIYGGRLQGLAGTATFCAEMLVAAMLPTLFLILRGSSNWLVRYFWWIVFGIEGLMLVGTGTRTGLVMLFVGLVLMLRSRLTKLFPIVLGTTIVIATVLTFLPEDLGISGAERMLSTEDTRSGAWQAGFEAFSSAPFFGISTEGRTILVENSYIDAFAMSGLVGVLPFVVGLGLFIRSAVQLYRRRNRLDRQTQLFADFLVGAFAAELIGAMFDAYLLATVSVQLYVIIIYTTLMIYVLDHTEEQSFAEKQHSISSAPLAYDPAYAI